jgi:hypothetical protein
MEDLNRFVASHLKMPRYTYFITVCIAHGMVSVLREVVNLIIQVGKWYRLVS